MNRSTVFAAVALTVATLAAAPAWAQDAGKTREQVKAELAEAQRTGDFIADFETGRKAYEIWPDQYPLHPTFKGKTRDQVKAELAEARRTGDFIANWESGQKAYELYPTQYPAHH